MTDARKLPPNCSTCGKFCSLYEKAPEGEEGDIYACKTCDLVELAEEEYDDE